MLGRIDGRILAVLADEDLGAAVNVEALTTTWDRPKT